MATRGRDLVWREALTAENKHLKQRLEAAERDNRALKLSVYDLSARLSAALARNGGAHSHSKAPGGDAASGAHAHDAVTAAALLDDVRTSGSAMRADLAELHEPPSAGGSHAGNGGAQVDGRHFDESCTLRGHGGAVYTVAFSPCGRLLASGSFDKSVRCWAVDGVEPTETLCLQKHTHHVSSLSWASDSRSLLSGSFDHTIRLWDLGTGVCERAWHVPANAFVQSVAHQPTSESIFAAATTTHALLLFDARIGADRPAAELTNGTMINSLLFLPRGEHVLSGDKHGALRSWDLRKRACVSCLYVGDARKPISHVSLSAPLPVSSVWASRTPGLAGSVAAGGALSGGLGGGVGGGLNGGFDGGGDARLLAVNSYDDTLRVYDGGFAPAAALGRPSAGAAEAPLSLDATAEPPPPPPAAAAHLPHPTREEAEPAAAAWAAAGAPLGSNGFGGMAMASAAHEERSDEPELSSATAAHALVGHRNRAYPIKSALYVGADYLRGGSARRPQAAQRPDEADADDGFGEDSLPHLAGSRAADAAPPPPSVHSSVLLATGSADGDAYVFDVSGPRGSGGLLQRLRGHTDRVYAVDFHPELPLLASGSADFGIKLWAPQAARRDDRAGRRRRMAES